MLLIWTIGGQGPIAHVVGEGEGCLDLFFFSSIFSFSLSEGWSGGAMVLGKLSEPGCPTNLDNRRTKAYCACSSCG